MIYEPLARQGATAEFLALRGLVDELLRIVAFSQPDRFAILKEQVNRQRDEMSGFTGEEPALKHMQAAAQLQVDWTYQGGVRHL